MAFQERKLKEARKKKEKPSTKRDPVNLLASFDLCSIVSSSRMSRSVMCLELFNTDVDLGFTSG